MTEEEFDSSILPRPFRHEDLVHAEDEAARFTALGLALWGRTPAELRRKLETPQPDIPAGCTLDDLNRLQSYLQRLSVKPDRLQITWLTPLTLSSVGMLAGSPALTGLEGRIEVVRRAIEHLKRT